MGWKMKQDDDPVEENEKMTVRERATMGAVKFMARTFAKQYGVMKRDVGINKPSDDHTMLMIKFNEALERTLDEGHPFIKGGSLRGGDTEAMFRTAFEIMELMVNNDRVYRELLVNFVENLYECGGYEVARDSRRRFYDSSGRDRLTKDQSVKYPR